jgi:hypothetical protein
MKSIDLRDINSNQQFNPEENLSEESLEASLSELYVFLLKECSVVLNSMFTDTIISRDVSDLAKNAFINDEEATKLQEYNRLLDQANDASADLRFDVAESIHMDRVQLVTHNASLASNKDIVHEVYASYGRFLLMQAASQSGSSSTNSLLSKAREVIGISYNDRKEDWEVALLYACILIESEQPEEAEDVIHVIISSQMLGRSNYDLQSLQDFDGYESEKMCPIDPKCHCVLASLFALQDSPIKARKALILANRYIYSIRMLFF